MPTGSDGTEGGQPDLSDLDLSAAQPAPSLTGPPVTPRQRIHFYSPDEWELFIREWATGLAKHYVQIKRLGGPNDRGIDVAAFKTKEGLEGPWDCFQGKHYNAALTMTHAVPEMVKLFVNVVARYYVLPDLYAFLAPRGCGPTLNRLLSKPTELREQFLQQLEPGGTHTSGMTRTGLEAVRDLAAETDFSLFRSVELDDALEIHSKTRYFTARFGGPLPSRPPIEDPPEGLADHEARYVAKLLDVYAEQQPADPLDEAGLSSHPQFGEHFRRQRISFYSAEALRLYARDSVPEGTFEALQNDIHGGVVEVAEASHACGMDRLRAVLASSTQLDLSAHALISVSRFDDRKGICHHLANEDRLTWTDQTA